MPELEREMAEKVENAEDGFKPLDPGVYVFFLRAGEDGKDIDVKMGDKGPYWSWTFEIPAEDAEGNRMPNAGRRLWLNTSLSENAFFRLKETYEAFGVPVGSNTALLIGRKVRLQVGHTIGQKGKMQGKLTNEIEHVLPLEGDLEGLTISEPLAATPADTAKPLF